MCTDWVQGLHKTQSAETLSICQKTLCMCGGNCTEWVTRGYGRGEENQSVHRKPCDNPCRRYHYYFCTSARKSLPFTAVPLVLDHTARALGALTGDKLDEIDFPKLRKVSSDTVDVLLRLKAVTKTKGTSSGTRMACRRGRACCRNRIIVKFWHWKWNFWRSVSSWA